MRVGEERRKIQIVKDNSSLTGVLLVEFFVNESASTSRSQRERRQGKIEIRKDNSSLKGQCSLSSTFLGKSLDPRGSAFCYWPPYNRLDRNMIVTLSCN